MNFPTVALANLTQPLQEKKRVGIVIENQLTAIAPSHHVIDRIKHWNANGQHGIFAGARRYLRLVRTLVLNEIPYLSPEGRAQPLDPAQIELSAHQTWTVLQQKWKAIPGHRQLLLDEDHPIGAWRRIVKEVHGIHLPETL